MSTSFTINITDDSIAECDETFTLTLSVPSSPCGVISGSVDTSEVMIRDDDGRKSVSEYVQWWGLLYTPSSMAHRHIHITQLY